MIDYLELVDWTGRIIREDKSGHILDSEPTIATRLSLQNDQWLTRAIHFEENYRQKVILKPIRANTHTLK